MFKVNDQQIKVTIFPDKTSQVWKLPEELFLMQTINIDWYFDHEGEVMHLVQLVDLFRSRGPRVINLYIDYLPYARQDKKVSNETTFALSSFIKVLNILNIDKISILDPHSNNYLDLNAERKYIYPLSFIDKAFDLTLSEVICYPDVGAYDRYYRGTNKETYFKKVRDSLSGEIIKIDIIKEMCDVKNKNILLVDDICDGGRTFVKAVELLYSNGAKEVNLYVTHGIFSAGLQPLFDAKIKRIFTKNGEATEVQGNLVYKGYDK